MDLNRTGSIWDRQNRNGINENWGKLEKSTYLTDAFIKDFDGERLLEQTINLFNKEQVGTGSINVNTGSANNDGFSNTGFVPVKPGTIYSAVPRPGIGVGAFYDGGFNYISGISSTERVFTTPERARYVRFTVSSASINSAMIYEGSAVKPYEPYGFKPAPLIIDNSGRDALTINQGSVYPLKLYQLGSGSLTIPDLHKNAVLDAKVFGAIPGKLYRLSYVSNGFVHASLGETWGITVTETNKDGSGARVVTNYNEQAGTRGSTGIDTIIQGNDEMMFSVTVDRKVISDSSIPTHMNMNTAPNVIIDPSNYSF